MKLTERQQAFADYYITSGNATESYMKAYEVEKIKIAEASSSRLLRNVKVKEYIDERNNAIKNDRIADMKEVKEFWSNTMRNKENDLKDRIKASELIGKTNAAFIDKVESENVTKIVLEGEVDEWAK
jgi:phage terminase small subunit